MRRRGFSFFDAVLWNAGGDGGGGGAGAGGGNEGGQQQQQQNAGGAQLWDMNDLPEGLRGATNEEAFGKVKGEYFNLRNKAAEFAAPKDAKEYKFEASDKLKPYFKNADDPMMGLAREAALKAGVPDKQFAPFITGVFEAAIEKGLIPPAYDPHAEIDGIGKLVAPNMQGEERKTAIAAAITEAEAFAPALADSLKLSDSAKKLLVGITGEAGGIEILRALKAGGKEFGLQLGGTQQQQGYSWADYDKDVQNPKYQAMTPGFDKSFRETVDAKMRALPPR